MTKICNETDMLHVLAEVYSDCLNAHDLERLADAIPAGYLVRSLLKRTSTDPLPKSVKDAPTGKALTVLRILNAWSESPERLGQLIDNATYRMELFYQLDEALALAVEEYVREHQ